jgi:hypothetical protein
MGGTLKRVTLSVLLPLAIAVAAVSTSAQAAGASTPTCGPADHTT